MECCNNFLNVVWVIKMDYRGILYLIVAGLSLLLLVVLINYIGLLLTALFIVFLVIAGIFCLVAFTTGFRKSGRIMGGLFALIGKPGSGKSYCATKIGLDRMKEGRTVFSNFSIVSVDGKYCSRVIEGVTSTGEVIETIKKLMRQNLTRCVLIFDEAHLFWWSRDFKRFTQEDKNFFTFLAQHEIEVYYIVQHENRMDTIANDCATLYGVVEKLIIPFIDMPLRFTITWWSDEELIRQSIRDSSIVPYLIEHFWFSKDVASAYDTRFFGHDERPRYQGISWIDFMLKYRNRPWNPPKDVSLQRFIRVALDKKYDQLMDLKNTIHYNLVRPKINKLVNVSTETKDKIEVVLDRVSFIRLVRSRFVYLYWRVYCLYVFNQRSIRKLYKGR